MADPHDDLPGPMGDSNRHRPLSELDALLAKLTPAPTRVGTLRLIVRRLANGTRATPDAVVLSVEEGVPGDAWLRRPPRNPEAQLAVMREDVAALIANEQPLTLFGDNLFVDLDLSAGNLPEGTRLRVGAALVTVTPKPHNGCLKFKARFGEDAFRFVQALPTRAENRRGIYWRVLESGRACIGDAIVIIDEAR